MLKSRKHRLIKSIVLGCVGLILGAIVVASIFVLQYNRTVDVTSEVIVRLGTNTIGTSTVWVGAGLVDEVIVWIQSQDTWVIFALVVVASIIVISILIFFAFIIYKIFFSSKNSRETVPMGYEDGLYDDIGDYGPAPATVASDYGSQSYDTASSSQLSSNVSATTQQLSAAQIPDVSGGMQLGNPVVDVSGGVYKRRLSNEIQDRLGFDINMPFVSQRIESKAKGDSSEEEQLEYQIRLIQSERATIDDRLVRVSDEYNLLKAQYDADVGKAENDIVEMQKEIADLQDWLYQAPKKEKNKILDEIDAREASIGKAYAHISALTDPNSGTLADINVLKDVQNRLMQAKSENEDELIKAKANVQMISIREELEAPERERVRKEKLSRLRDMMRELNQMQAEDDAFEEKVAKRNKEKELLKTENITLQHAIMSTVDLEEVVSVSQKIQANNQLILELDKKNSEDLRNRTARPASIGKLKRDADDLILDLKLSYADVVQQEDEVLIEVTKERMIADINESKRVAQDIMIKAQHQHDSLTQDYHRHLTDAAFDVSNAMRDAENEVVAVSNRLKDIVDKLAIATGPKANLLTIDRLAAEDALQLAKVNLERVKAQGIKDRISAKTRLDSDIVEAAKDIDKARREYDLLIEKQRNIDKEAAYVVITGSGVVSKMRKESEALEKEREKEKKRAQEEYEKRKAELLGEREQLGDEITLETRLQLALQQDVIKAQKGDKEARTRLEHNLISRMHDNERELFDKMRPDEKWRYIVMEVEEIIRKAHHYSKEKLAAIVAEEEALHAKYLADEKVRKAEEAADIARRKMEAELIQSQIDVDYAKLQSMDTVIAAKELADKQTEELMRVAYEERRKAGELIDSVKQRSIEAKKQAEAIVKNIGTGSFDGLMDASAANVASSNLDFNDILESAMRDNYSLGGGDTGIGPLERNISLDPINPKSNLGDQSPSVSNNQYVTFHDNPQLGNNNGTQLFGNNQPVPEFNSATESNNMKYTGPIHSKSDFGGNNSGQPSYSQIDAEIGQANRELDYAKSELNRAMHAASYAIVPESTPSYSNTKPTFGEDAFFNEQSKAVDIEQLINAKLEERLKQEDRKRSELEEQRLKEEKTKQEEEIRQSQIEEELEKIRNIRRKIEQEQSQQKLLLEEKHKLETQKVSSYKDDEYKAEQIKQQAIAFEKQNLLIEKQAIEAQKRALEEEKKALETERLIKQQVEDTKRQLKEEQAKIEEERQRQIEQANREVERLRQELLEEKQKEELRRVEEEKQKEAMLAAQQVETLRQQVLQEQEKAEKAEKEKLKREQDYRQTALTVEQEQDKVYRTLEEERIEMEEEMKRATYLVDEANQRAMHAEQNVREQVYTVANDIRKMAEEAAAQAAKQAQEAKAEAERVRNAMEQEILRVRQELENTKKAQEIDAQIAAIEAKAKEEVKEAKARAERAEALAKQAEATEINAKNKVEEAIANARKAAEDAIADAVKQSQSANEMISTIRAQADQEVISLKQELQKELQNLRAERDKEIEQRAKEYERALQNAEVIATSRAEQAEQAFKSLEQATQRALQESEKRAEQTLKEVQERANQQAQLAEERARQEAKLAEERAELKAKEAEERARQVEERARQEAKLAEEKAQALAKEAEEKAQALAKAAEEKAVLKAKEVEEKLVQQALQIKQEQELARQQAKDKQEREDRVAHKIAVKKAEIVHLRERISQIKTEADLNIILERLNTISQFLDEDEKSTKELGDLISRTIIDARHASDMALLRAKLDETVANSVAQPKIDNAMLPPPLRRPRPPLRRRALVRPGMRPMSRRPRMGARPPMRSRLRPPSGRTRLR
jgi:hypothetical protein